MTALAIWLGASLVASLLFLAWRMSAHRVVGRRVFGHGSSQCTGRYWCSDCGDYVCDRCGNSKTCPRGVVEARP